MKRKKKLLLKKNNGLYEKDKLEWINVKLSIIVITTHIQKTIQDALKNVSSILYER